jgi:DTW domain-containing protein YfiP
MRCIPEKWLAPGGQMRFRCVKCLQPEFSCFCSWLRPFDPKIEFAILIHPIEMKRRRITTGRLSHLSLKNSHLIMGEIFTDELRVNSLIHDPSRHCVLLYPGRKSSNLTDMCSEGVKYSVPEGRKLTVFVVDGTWGTAKKTVNQSPNLNTLPRICFTPQTPSTFRVRKQPRIECYSTIEAIHQTIDLLGPAVGFPTVERVHDRLLSIFDQMVNRQLELKMERGKPGGRHFYTRSS